jgi:23S rRNA (adenine-N6)-dimethyltransferase
VPPALAAGGSRPERLVYAQNFLRDTRLVGDLVERSGIGPGDLVYDIGAGRGAITKALSARAGRVVAVEIDPTLAARLQRDLSSMENVTVVAGDFLRMSLPQEDYKVFSNIPFNQTARIVRHLLDAGRPPTDAYVVVEKGAAQGLAGRPLARRDSLFAVTHKPWFAFAVEHRFDRFDFDPPPAVDAVLLRIERLERPLLAAAEAPRFQRFVASGFGAGRSTKSVYQRSVPYRRLMAAAGAASFSVKTPPADLGVEAWVSLYAAHREAQAAGEVEA